MAKRTVDEFDIVASNGSLLRVWHTAEGGSRPSVLLCPGLGSLPEAWPDLLQPQAPARVVSWYHRGTFGSGRPENTQHIALSDHVEDAVATLDHAEVERCTVVGWSAGASVASELARAHPKRVSGLMLLGGTPGASFDTLLGGFGVPQSMRRLIAIGGTTSLRLLGPVLDAVLHRIPVNELSAQLLQYSRVVRPSADRAAVETALRRFLQHDWRWYFTLALALGTSEPVDISGVRCPVTVIAGRYDLLADVGSISKSVAGLPQARLRVLPTSHFVPLEAPDEINEELRLLLRRAETVAWASQGVEPVR